MSPYKATAREYKEMLNIDSVENNLVRDGFNISLMENIPQNTGRDKSNRNMIELTATTSFKKASQETIKKNDRELRSVSKNSVKIRQPARTEKFSHHTCAGVYKEGLVLNC